MPASPYRNDPRITVPQAARDRLSISTVIVPVAPLHRKASRRSGQDTQLLYGHRFDVYGVSKGWAWGQSRSPVTGSKVKGYVGYMPSKYLEERSERASHVVSALKAPIFVSPDIKSHIIQSLPLGALVKGQGRHPRFVQIGAGGYIHRNHLRKRGEEVGITDFVTIAEAHMGLPYVWGGMSTDGLDCSGLVLSSLRAIGGDAPRDTDMMEAQLGAHLRVTRSGLKRGDLIFWKGHVGIMQTSGRMIHANAHHMSVTSEPLRDAAARIAESGGGPISAVKRLAPIVL